MDDLTSARGVNDVHTRSPTRPGREAALGAWARERRIPALLGHDADALPDLFPSSPNIDFGKLERRVPLAVLTPRDQGELAACLQMCVAERLPIKIRGAAHSSGGQTLTDDGVVIDLRGLDRILADSPSNETIRVECGLWWLPLCQHLHAQGRRPRILTDNWRVSVGGTLAVGGFGDTTHREGLQIASVRALTVMTLDGTRHEVGPGDALFDWALAGRGQLGVITEAVIATTRASYDLDGRVLAWRSVFDFLRDSRAITNEQRFDLLRARMMWTHEGPVGAAAGHFVRPGATGADTEGTARVARDFSGLVGRVGARERIDLFAEGIAEPPAIHWAPASPGVELVLPLDGKGLAALQEIHRRVSASELAPLMPRGSSMMVLSGADRTRFPMAPLPATDLVVLIAIRPEVPVENVARFIPFMREIADYAIRAGGQLYLMSLAPTRKGWFADQLGAERFRRLVALKTEWDPLGLLNPGLIDSLP